MNVTDPPTPLQMNTGPITEEEIEKAVRKLKNNKAPGNDCIHPEMLKYGGQQMTMILQIICNTVWTSEKIPEDWKIGTIITLPKKGDLSNRSKLKGITLLSLPSKVLCIVIFSRLKEHIYR